VVYFSTIHFEHLEVNSITIPPIKTQQNQLKLMPEVPEYCGVVVLQLEIVGNDGSFYFQRIQASRIFTL
jgi:hypothetical protein